VTVWAWAGKLTTKSGMAAVRARQICLETSLMVTLVVMKFYNKGL
jgi:hypothetical protein